jgi:hypothetical protein
MNPKNEPVAIGTVLVPLVVWLAARYGFKVDADTAIQIAGALVVIGAGAARAMVRTKRTLPNPDAVKPNAL